MVDYPPIAIDCPVRLVHGERDDDVPLAIALRTLEQLRSADVQLVVVKGGGHGGFRDPKVPELTREFLRKHLAGI